MAGFFNDGARYNSENPLITWTNTASSGAPRHSHTPHGGVDGDGNDYLGGLGASSPLNSGARYNPVTDTWTVMTTAGAPATRLPAPAVWTGSEMIVWGGLNGSVLNEVDVTTQRQQLDGGNDNRRALRALLLTAVWTGSEIIVWGGFNGSHLKTTAGATILPQTTGRDEQCRRARCAPEHTAVWTGSEMIVWGGFKRELPERRRTL